MTVGFMRADRQTGIQKQHAAIRPRGEESTVAGWRLESRIVVAEGGVDVFERGGCRGGGPDGEAETVGLVVVVVGVLAEDHGFDGGERGVSGPRV